MYGNVLHEMALACLMSVLRSTLLVLNALHLIFTLLSEVGAPAISLEPYSLDPQSRRQIWAKTISALSQALLIRTFLVVLPVRSPF